MQLACQAPASARPLARRAGTTEAHGHAKRATTRLRSAAMRRPIFLIALFAALAILAAAPEVQGDKPTCKRCEARPAVWGGKPKGYALAADGAAAQKLAEERAFADARSGERR